MRLALPLGFLLCAACGSVSVDPDASRLADADLGTPDAADPVDANTTPDAEPTFGTVTVRVLQKGTAKSGVDVVFHDAAGTVLSSMTTDADGKASFDMMTGGMVTALMSGGYAHTFAGVKPGDELIAIDHGFTRGGQASQGSIAFPMNPPGGTTLYYILTGCGPSSTAPQATYPVFIGPDCGVTNNETTSIVLLARSASATLGYTLQKDLSYVNPNLGTINFAPWVNGGVVTSTYSVQGITAALQYAYVTAEMVVSGSNVYEGPNGFDLTSVTMLAQSHDFPGGFADAYVHRIRLKYPYDSTNEQTPWMILYDRVASPTSNKVYDLATVGLPKLDWPARDFTDVTRPIISWTPPSGLGDADGGMLMIRWSTDASGGEARWVITFPPGASSVTYPALPAPLAARRPTSAFNPISFEHLTLLDAPNLVGYDAYRRTAQPHHDLWLFTPPANGLWRITQALRGD